MIILNGASLDNKSRCSQSLMSWANEFGLDADVMHNPEECWVTREMFAGTTRGVYWRPRLWQSRLCL